MRRPWCARLTAYDSASGTFRREFLVGQKDYSQANFTGSRGVYLHFWLPSGYVYEVHEILSWEMTRRWFATVREDGTVVEISREGAIRCLS